MKRILFIILLGTLLVLPLMAGPIRVSVRDTTVLRGKTFYLPVWIDSTVTGLNVKSYELDISYSSGAMFIDSVITLGTMTQNWDPPAFHLSNGRITIANAGTTPLDGVGLFLLLKVTLPVSSTWSYGSITFNRVFFNEGTPATIFRNGTVNITNLPIITVSPNNAILTVGDTRQFSATGGTAPYTWITTDPFIASISPSGLLTAQHGGFCRVVTIDNNGITDTTLDIEVRSFKLTVRDTSYLQGQTLNIPVYVSDLSLIEVHSGTFSVSFNSNVLTSLGVVKTGTLLQPFPDPVTNIDAGKITIAFASDTGLLRNNGSNILLFLRFKVTDVNNYGTTMQIGDVMFNESITGNVTNGTFNVILRAVLTVTPNTATVVAPDSLQFNVSGGATPPIVWSVSDTSLAAISASGMLKAKKSGIIQVSVLDQVGASGTSGNITLYDMRIQLSTASGKAGDTVAVNIQVGTYAPGIFSAQFTLSYYSAYFQPIDLVTIGTLFEGRMNDIATPTPGYVNVTAAGATPAYGPGTLMKVRFKILDGTPLSTYPVNFTSVLLNEGKPSALPANGSITVGTTGVGDNNSLVPDRFSLLQNYPNPFNPTTNIRFQIAESRFVSLKVYDVLGREAATLMNKQLQPGTYDVTWDADGFPSGLYFYILTAGDFTDVKKLILLR